MFLNALMLAGLAGASVPLVLHLLARARYRKVDWGAMMFLLEAQSHQHQSTRLKQIILLLLRMAIVAALAVALARPVVSRDFFGLTQRGRATAVIVLDRSASMGVEEEARTRLDVAREAALRILSGLRPGDLVSLVLIGDPGKPVTELPTSDIQSVAGRIAALKPSATRADVADGLSRALKLLQDREPGNRELYLITDRQANNWDSASVTFQATFADQLNRGAASARFVVVPVGSDLRDNIVVESINLLSKPAIVDQPLDIELRVRNFGPTPHVDVPLVLLGQGGRPLFKTSLTLGPDASTTVRAGARFDRAGTQVLTAELGKGEGDDRTDVAIDVVPPVRVLIVSGDERPGAFRSESDFVRVALAPFASLGRKGPDVASVVVKPSDAWTPSDQTTCDVLILANLPQMSATLARSVESFVYGGGGLLIAPGNLTRTENFNSTLFRDGSGMSPALLMPATPGDGSAATSLLGLDLAHPLFQFLRGRPDPVPTSTVGRYFPVTVRDTDARVLARYASGQPFAVEANAGRGRVLMLTTPLDADWGTLPLSSFYLPFAQNAVRYLASVGEVRRNLAPGEPIVATYDTTPDQRQARVIPPDRAEESVQLLRVGDRYEARFNDTERPGRYRVRVRIKNTDVEQTFVVSRPAEEADLSPLTEQRWTELSETMKFERVDPARTDLASTTTAARTGRELWPMLLALVLGLMFTELGLARRWSREGV